MKDALLNAWAGIRGFHTSRRLIIFESDDWGAIRTRDRRTLEALLAEGIAVHASPYNRLDCLETSGDLDRLFDVLSSHLNSKGERPIFTFNTVLGNPNFPKIRACDYQEYHCEDLFQSYQTYGAEDLRSVWQSAINESLIRPQFHGREHLNVDLWLNDLRAGRKDTRRAFDLEFFSLTTVTSSQRQRNYRAAFWPESLSHFRRIEEILQDGMQMFSKFFGYHSRSFIPCNYVLPRELEPLAADLGIELIQGQRGQLCPDASGKKLKIRRPYTGERNEHGQKYSVRNVVFEPFSDYSRDWTDTAMHDIGQAFAFRKPAIVSTHRVNYVGGLDESHRDRSLVQLDRLLSSILRKWPDVEFLASDDLIDVMSNAPRY